MVFFILLIPNQDHNKVYFIPALTDGQATITPALSFLKQIDKQLAYYANLQPEGSSFTNRRLAIDCLINNA